MTEIRIKKDLAQVRNEKEIEFSQVKSDHNHFKAIIKGPSETPYENGKFQIDIRIPDNYPFSPPKMQFDTRIWHPNVSSQTGAICLDILKDEWSPALSIRTALISIQALLNSAEPDNPQDAVVAKQYKEDRELFNKTAAEWTDIHAKGANPHDFSIKKLIDMGFCEDDVKVALEKSNWNEDEAIQVLLQL